MAAWPRAIRASAASPLKVLAASYCCSAKILLRNSVHALSLSSCRICLYCSVVMVLGVLVPAAASVLSCCYGLVTLVLSSDSVLMFSSQSAWSYLSVSSYVPVMFDILVFVVL